MLKFGDTRLPGKVWDKIIPEPNTGCWLWLGARTSAGYGATTFGKKQQLLHRVMICLDQQIYLPSSNLKWVTDHICNTRCCCNPDHLQIVTPADNNRLIIDRTNVCRFCKVESVLRKRGYLCENCRITPHQSSLNYRRSHREEILKRRKLNRHKTRDYERRNKDRLNALRKEYRKRKKKEKELLKLGKNPI